jgi:hypothetical protein
MWLSVSLTNRVENTEKFSTGVNLPGLGVFLIAGCDCQKLQNTEEARI